MTPKAFYVGTRPKDNPVCTSEGLVGTYLLAELDFVLNAPRVQPYFALIQSDGASTTYADEKEHAFLNLHCRDDPSEPEADHAFDHVLILDVAYNIPEPGSFNTAIALLKVEEEDMTRSTMPKDKKNSGISKYQYMGKLGLERLANHEATSASQTITFRFGDNAGLDTKGRWKIEKICLT